MLANRAGIYYDNISFFNTVSQDESGLFERRSHQLEWQQRWGLPCNSLQIQISRAHSVGGAHARADLLHPLPVDAPVRVADARGRSHVDDTRLAVDRQLQVVGEAEDAAAEAGLEVAGLGRAFVPVCRLDPSDGRVRPG